MKIEKAGYEAPETVILEIEAEQFFAASSQDMIYNEEEW